MRKSLSTQTAALFMLLSACGGGSGSSDNNTVTLSWIAPTTRSDGSLLKHDNVAGYRIYWGKNIDELQLHTDIADATVSTINLSASSDDICYYGITTYDIYNLESELSNIVSK
jgi:fibronectin type 3 domain-containing protein